MDEFKKDTRYTVRVTDAHHNKLMKLLKASGQTISQWVRDRIEQQRIK